MTFVSLEEQEEEETKRSRKNWRLVGISCCGLAWSFSWEIHLDEKGNGRGRERERGRKTEKERGRKERGLASFLLMMKNNFFCQSEFTLESVS